MEWQQPHFDQDPGFIANGSHPASSTWPGLPAPRGGHSATLIGHSMFIFGGYGGHGSIWRLFFLFFAAIYLIASVPQVTQDVTLMIFTALMFGRGHGRGLLRRDGAQAALWPPILCGEASLFILGGWNASQQFDDLFIMETKLNPPVWSCVEGSFSAPRWNFAACSVMAIPAWKVFVYGGLEGELDGDNNRQGVLCGDITVLDAGLNRWTCPLIDGHVQPKARADSVLVYDSKSSRLILFGGWANEWLGDIFTLDVAHLVGPPYAIMDLYPQTGPITGSTALQITGIDFVNTKDVVVRFSSQFGTVDVHGEFLSSTQLVCIAPDFSAYPAGAVDVRVALNGDSFTTTSQVYTFFAVTSAQNSLIFGPGLLNGGACNEETMFIIQAKDNLNCNRTTGGDEFIASINLLGGGENGEDVQLRNGVEVRDNDDGTYYVGFTAPSPGTYMVAVEFLGTFGGSPGQVRGSQVSVHFEEFVPRSNNAMTGKLVSLAVQQDIQTLAAFCKSVATGIQAKPSDNGWTDLQNQAALVSVKEHLNMIQEMKQEIDLLFDRLECILSHHKMQGINIGPQEKLVESYRTSWEASQLQPEHIFKIAPLYEG